MKNEKSEYTYFELYKKFLPIAFLILAITLFLYTKLLTRNKFVPINTNLFALIVAFLGIILGLIIYFMFHKRIEQKIISKNKAISSKFQYNLYFVLWCVLAIIISIILLGYAYFISTL